MLKSVTLMTASAAAFATPALAAEPDTYGSIALSGIYSSQSGEFDTEEINGSAVVPRITLGARWNEDGNQTRIEGTSAYWNYFDRKNRFYNSVEVEQRLRLSDTVQFGIEGSGTLNTATLEARSADQVAAIGRVIVRPQRSDTLVLGGGIRRRWYDDSSARSWSPILYGDYRHRFGRDNFLDLGLSHEWINANQDVFDYRRTYAAAFYTHPLGKRTRVRAGVSYRWWNWDARFTLDGRERRDRLWLPQLRLEHDLTRALDLDLTYRRIIRRSNDDRLDRNGNYASATLRYRF